MKTKDIKIALGCLFEAKITPMLVGHKGVGKSSAVRDYALEHDIPYIDLRLGLMDVGDLIGLPDFKEVHGHRVTTFNAPEWFPLDPNSKGIIFLDEINRARPDVLQAVFQLVLDRKLGQHVLPNGWNVVAAMNPDQEGYKVTDINDSAFISRFCHIKVENSTDDWLQYANSKKFDRNLIRFISNHPAMLYGNLSDIDLSYVKPDGRAYEAVSRLLAIKDVPEVIQSEIISGLIGVESTITLKADMAKQQKPVNGSLVLEDYLLVRPEILAQMNIEDYRSDLLNDTKNQVFQELDIRKDTLEDKEYNNLLAFCMDLPNDLCEDFLRKMIPELRVIHEKLALEDKLVEKIIPKEWLDNYNKSVSEKVLP